MGNKQGKNEAHDLMNVGFSVSEVNCNPEQQYFECEQLTGRIECDNKIGDQYGKEFETNFETKQNMCDDFG